MRRMGHMNDQFFTISAAASLLELHPRTLRNYEKAGLVTPSRKGSWRYYSMDDITWIRCLFEMIHSRGIGIASIAKLLCYAPCWEVAECGPSRRSQCPLSVATRPATGGAAPRSTSVRCAVVPGT